MEERVGKDAKRDKLEKDYTISRFGPMIEDWLNSCKCLCETE